MGQSISPVHAQSMDFQRRESPVARAPKPFIKKLDFSKIESAGIGLSTIKDDNCEDTHFDKHDEAVVNMLQNEEELKNVNMSRDSNKFGYAF